jgi:hypothetical protein
MGQARPVGDHFDEAQWDLSADRFIDGPFRRLDRGLRAVNADDDRPLWCVRIAPPCSRSTFEP